MIPFIPGPYLGVAGAAFLEKPICEPLVPVMPLFILPHNERMLLETARLFKALKIALSDLEKFYDQLSNQQDLDISGLNDQLCYPYIDHVKIGEVNAKLTYTDKRGDHIFNAEMKYGSASLSHNVIVKFTKRYSRECHDTCYNMGFAPELFACERIAGGWYIVVMELLMEYCTAYSLAEEYHLSSRTLKQVKTLVEKMHDLGFVHGDLRLPNILVGPESSVN